MRKTLRKLLIPVCVSVVALGLLAFMAAKLFASTSAEDLIGRAKVWAGESDYERAISDLDELIATYPTSDLVDDAHFLKGQYLMSLGKNEEALQEYKAIIEEHYTGDMAEGAIEKLAIVYTKLRDIEGGLAYVASVLQTNPANDAAKKARWEIMRRAKRVMTIPLAGKILAACNDLANTEVNAEELAQLKLGAACCIKELDKPKAQQNLEEIVNTAGEFPEIRRGAMLELASIYASNFPCGARRDPDNALRLLEEIIASAPESKEARQARIQLVTEHPVEDLDRGFSLFVEAVKERPDEPTTVSALNGFVSNVLGDEPRNVEVQEKLAAMAEDMKGTALGTQAEVWVSILPDPVALDVLTAIPPEMLVPLAWSYSRQCRADELELIADELIARGEDDQYANGVFHKAGLYCMRGDYATAAELYGEAIHKYPNGSWVPDMMYAKLCTERRMGDFQAAIRTADDLRAAHPHAPETAAALYGKALILENELRDVPAATTAYQELVDAYPETCHARWAASRLAALSSE